MPISSYTWYDLYDRPPSQIVLFPHSWWRSWNLGSTLGQEDPLEEGMATHSNILAWKIPWTEDPGGPQSTGHKESDRYDWSDSACLGWFEHIPVGSPSPLIFCLLRSEQKSSQRLPSVDSPTSAPLGSCWEAWVSPRGASLASYKGRGLRGVGLQFWLSDTYNFLGICTPQFSSWSKAESEQGGHGTSSQPWNFMTSLLLSWPRGSAPSPRRASLAQGPREGRKVWCWLTSWSFDLPVPIPTVDRHAQWGLGRKAL